MSNIQKHIKDLIFFYVKTNYENHLKINNIQFIPDDSLEAVISSLYDDRKDHLQEFIKSSLKKLLKDEYPGDLVILNILLEIFADDNLCKNRLLVEIKLHQQKVTKGKNDYSKLL